MTTHHGFTRQDIEGLLTELSLRLHARGVAATLYVVGGAAIALRGVSGDRRTRDVDALMVPEAEILAEAHQLAADRGVSPNWLSSAVRPFVPTPLEGLNPPLSPGLEVRTAPDEHLLAMKIVAARGQRDMRDIIPLARRLGVSTAEELVAMTITAYGNDAIEHVHGGRGDLVLHCQAIERVLNAP